MEKTSLKELQQELSNVSSEKKHKEEELQEVKEQLDRLHVQFEQMLQDIQALQEREGLLQSNISILQKEALKEALSMKGIKGLLNSSSFVQKIKEKGQALKEALDPEALNKQWLEEQYAKYKQACIKKGQEIKTKEEFKTMIMQIKELNPASDEGKVTEVIERATTELSKAGKVVHEVVKNFNTDKLSQLFGQFKAGDSSEQPAQPSSPSSGCALHPSDTPVAPPQQEAAPDLSHCPSDGMPQTKQEALSQWIVQRQLHSDLLDDVNQSYEQYITYLNWLYDNQVPEHMVYSSKGGAFKTALKRYFNQQAVS